MLYELLKSRRSIRKFKNQPVEQDKVDILVKSALLSPSSRGKRPWSFVVVDDGDLLGKLAKSKAHGSAFLEGALLAIVVAADPGISDVWIEDTSIAATLIQLAAEDMGLGSCWIQIRLRQDEGVGPSEDHVKNVLNIPGQLKVASIIAIGYPDESKAPYDEDSLLYDRVRQNGHLVYFK